MGNISENVDFTEIKPTDGRLIFNLVELGELNSIGCLSLLRFVNSLGKTKIEFHNCPISFLDLVNMIPTMLGPNQDPSALKSIEIPYECTEHETVKLFVDSKELKITGKDVFAPARKCTDCDRDLTIEEDIEFFLQIMAG